MSEAGCGERQNGRGDGVLDVQRPPDGQQRRRRHVEIEHTFADEDPDNGDQRGDHGTGHAARPQSTNVHDAVRPRGRRSRCSHGSTPMLAVAACRRYREPSTATPHQHRLLGVSRPTHVRARLPTMHCPRSTAWCGRGFGGHPDEVMRPAPVRPDRRQRRAAAARAAASGPGRG